jgi:hypothetical protein
VSDATYLNVLDVSIVPTCLQLYDEEVFSQLIYRYIPVQSASLSFFFLSHFLAPHSSLYPPAPFTTSAMEKRGLLNMVKMANVHS